MPEQFGFEQILGDRAQVHRDEDVARAARLAVEVARDQLLAGAVLAEDQDVRLGRRGALDQRIDPPHRRRVAEQGGLAARRRDGDGDRALALGDRGLARGAQRRGGADGGEKPFVGPGLGDEVGGPALHRLDGDVDSAMGGDHHHHRLRVLRQYLAEPVEALGGVGRAPAEIRVEQDDVGAISLDRRHRLFGGLEGGHVFEDVAEQEAGGQQYVLIVVDDDAPPERLPLPSHVGPPTSLSGYGQTIIVPAGVRERTGGVRGRTGTVRKRTGRARGYFGAMAEKQAFSRLARLMLHGRATGDPRSGERHDAQVGNLADRPSAMILSVGVQGSVRNRTA